MEHHTQPPFDSEIPDTPVCVRGPAALAAALPYLIDLPPQGRVVLAVVGAQTLLGRLVHAPIDPFPAGASPELRRQWASEVVRLIGDGLALLDPGADGSLAVAVYLPAEAELTDAALTHKLRELVPVARGRLLDMITVQNGRWRSVLCTNDECCPADGAVILDNSDAVRVSAELVGAGLAGWPETGQWPGVEGLPEVGAELVAMTLPRTTNARRTLLRQVWPLIASAPPGLSPVDAARLAMAADRPGVRDAILIRMAKWRSADPSRWVSQGELWRLVVQAAPPQWRAGAACMLAITHWARTDWDAASAALELALAAEPDHKMAGLIERLLASGIPASDWFTRMSGISESECLRFDRPPGRESAPPQQQSAS